MNNDKNKLKPVVILTFPRTGGSMLVHGMRYHFESNKNYRNVSDELTDCTQEKLFSNLSVVNDCINNGEICVTKLHLNKYINFRYPLILDLINWINNLSNVCNFLILKRENKIDLCLSNLKSQYSNLWGPEGGKTLLQPITVPKFAVEKFNLEYEFFNLMCAEFNSNIPVLTYEKLYYSNECHNILLNLIGYVPSILNKKFRYGEGNQTDFANLQQIKEWIK